MCNSFASHELKKKIIELYVGYRQQEDKTVYNLKKSIYFVLFSTQLLIKNFGRSQS